MILCCQVRIGEVSSVELLYLVVQEGGEASVGTRRLELAVAVGDPKAEGLFIFESSVENLLHNGELETCWRRVAKIRVLQRPEQHKVRNLGFNGEAKPGFEYRVKTCKVQQ